MNAERKNTLSGKIKPGFDVTDMVNMLDVRGIMANHPTVRRRKHEQRTL